VNTITRHVSSCGCNIEDSRLAMLGEEFTFIMLLSGTWNAITLIESTLPLKGAELDLLIVMKRTTARPRPAMPATVWVQVEVPDSPHLIERFTALFDSHQMNIAELVSRTQTGETAHFQCCLFRLPRTALPRRMRQISSKRLKPSVQN
jgi:glycine cleavage system transcriptional repressor